VGISIDDTTSAIDLLSSLRVVGVSIDLEELLNYSPIQLELYIHSHMKMVERLQQQENS